jgi:hypothetical protein
MQVSRCHRIVPTVIIVRNVSGLFSLLFSRLIEFRKSEIITNYLEMCQFSSITMNIKLTPYLESRSNNFVLTEINYLLL